MTTPLSAGPGPSDAPFLETDPPPWAARGLSTLLIVLFIALAIAAVVVRVPETVAGPFVLVPERGADPIRSPREGIISEVRVTEGQSVARGATLFAIRSEPVGDRRAEMRALEVQRTGAEGQLANARAEYESQRQADSMEARRLDAKLASLDRLAALKRKQLAIATEMAEQSKSGAQRGAVGGWEAARVALEADQLAGEVEETAQEQEETRAARAKLRQDVATRDVRYRELVRSLREETAVAEARLAGMRQQLTGEPGSDLVVAAPCAGTMLRLTVSTVGAVVQPGDALGEIACAGERLYVEMTLGQRDVARVRAGQGAKLLYDAFPYQRYGVRFGHVRWVGPATSGRASATAAGGDAAGGGFRALIEAGDSAIVVRGEPRPLLVGMRGRARVVTGRRTLISYAFEPIRALRESFAGAPPGPTS